MTKEEPSVLAKYLPFILLSLLLVLGLLSLKHKTPTFDEGRHFGYGLKVIDGDASRFDDSKMPFSVLNCLPHKFGSLMLRTFGDVDRFHALRYYQAARVMTLLFSLLIGWYIYRWARELYGWNAGILALALYVLSPNIIAHSRLITTDIYAMGMILIATYHFRKLLQEPSWKNAGISAFTFSLAQLAKYSGVFLVPIFAMILLVKFAQPAWGAVRAKNWSLLWRKLQPWGLYLLLFVVVFMVIINLGFLFHRSFTPLAGYEFKSELFQKIQNHLGPLAELPVPLPHPYLQGLDWTRYNETQGGTFGQIYLLGQLAERGQGFPGYYFIAWLYKIPIAIQLLFYFALGHYLWKFRDFHFRRDEFYLLIPVLFFVVYLNFFLSAQLGIRYLLVILPFVFIFTGSLIRKWTRMTRRSRILVDLAVAGMALSNVTWLPHYLSYFNAFVWDRKQAYRILADSNLDWGQNQLYLAAYCQVNPDAKIKPDGPVAGKIIISSNDLLGITANPEKYRWLRENFKPVNHVAYSYLVFEIDKADLAKLK